jgi:cytochrome P450
MTSVLPHGTETLPDPFTPGIHQDPYPAYRKLRESGAVHPSAIGLPAYYRYADVAAILRDRHWGVSFYEKRLEGARRLGTAQTFLHQNPPEHTRLRKLVSKAFTPSAVAAMRPHVIEVCNRLLGSAIADTETDLISAYAYPLPLTVICELLGVPAADYELIHAWSHTLSRGIDPAPSVTPEILEQRNAAVLDFNRYLAALAKQRRACPADDMVTRLTQVQEDGGLSELDLLATCVLILAAGHETTVNLIGNGVLALLRNPTQLAMVREARPEISDTWIDELLRYDSPVQVLRRSAQEDLEYGGRTYKRGDTVAVVTGSANRDAAVFTDPEVLDLARQNVSHMSFGLGIHFCLGATLARLEGELAISTLLRRAPGLCLAEDDPPFRDNVVMRGLERLPVRLR